MDDHLHSERLISACYLRHHLGFFSLVMYLAEVEDSPPMSRHVRASTAEGERVPISLEMLPHQERRPDLVYLL
jgi:hypothetical protein